MVSFFVPGIPKPAGSKRAFFNPKTHKPIVVDSSGKPGKDWRGDVKRIAMDHWRDDPVDYCVSLQLWFQMPRPKAHYNSKGKLRDSAPFWCPKRPDVGKLARAVEDALTGIIWKDDSQIVTATLDKHYDEKPGVWINVFPQPEPQKSKVVCLDPTAGITILTGGSDEDKVC